MSSRIFAILVVGGLTTLSAVSAVGPSHPMHLRPNVPGKSVLHVAGSRSAQQRSSAGGSKYDASLAEIARHVSSLRAGAALQDLHVLNPAARFSQPANSSSPLVLIDAVTKGDPQKLKAALVGLGLQRAAQYSNDVGGWLPVDQLDAATALTEVHAIRAAMMRTKSGAVTSQGDYAQNSDLVRSDNSLDGTGITVGVLSDSYDCYSVYAASGVPAGGNAGYANNGFNTTAAGDTATGDLPATVNIVDTDTPGNGEANCLAYGAPIQLPFGDEGRAMMQIIHDVAPGASLAFHTAENSEADLAAGIIALAAPVSSGGGGAKVIVDDVGYFDEPFFQDGVVAQAINAVFAQGVAYFSSAGNNGVLAYNNNTPNFSFVSSSSPNTGEKLLNFAPSGAPTATTTMLPVTIPALIPGEFVVIVVEWDQPYVTGAPNSGGSTSQIDVCITGAAGNDIIANGNLQAMTCSGPSSLGQDPVQIMIIDNPANAAGNSSTANLNIMVGLSGGATPGRIKVVVEDDGAGSQITNYATNSGTLQGHPSATGAAAVGAAFFPNTISCGATTPSLEGFSSAGGDPILFDVNGTRLATPVMRQKPDFVGPDGGNNTFLGFTIKGTGFDDSSTVPECANNDNFPNFLGTSAAAPHVASIAALLLQADPALTPTEIYSVLQQGGAPMGATPDPTATTPIFNFDSGYGFVQANIAAQKIPAVLPPAPTLTLASTSIVMGGSTTLTWSSVNTSDGCTASGSWSGPLASNGTQTVNPSAVGSDTYTLVCANFAGTSPATSATLSVTAATPPPSSGGGGGGALGLSTLLGLLALCAARARHLLRSRPARAIHNAVLIR
jgi:Subtilase family